MAKRPTFEQARDELAAWARALGTVPADGIAELESLNEASVKPVTRLRGGRWESDNGIPARKYVADSIAAAVKQKGATGGCFDWFATASPASLKRWINPPARRWDVHT